MSRGTVQDFAVRLRRHDVLDREHNRELMRRPLFLMGGDVYVERRAHYANG